MNYFINKVSTSIFLNMGTIFLAILCLETLNFPGNSWGAAYYVMPSGACGNGDGTTQACDGPHGAFDGFSNITWGTNGVKAGDTLYLISGKTYTGSLTIQASRSA
jgi:hypothetical protein